MKQEDRKVDGVDGSLFLIFSVLAAVAATLFLYLLGAATVRARPDSPDEQLQRALGYLRNGHYAEAEQGFTTAYLAGGDPTLCLGCRAECLYYLNRDEEALQSCRELAAKVPNAGRANYIRGLVLERQGLTGEAEVQFRKAASHGEKIAVVHLQRKGP